MGRGRQKAKDAKIARQLKYTNHSGDLRELERELIGGKVAPAAVEEVQADEEEFDEYVDRWAEDDEDE